MCDDCFAKHQLVPRFAKHETVPFDPLLVCTEHPHKMVECFCHQCTKMVCDECIFEVHGEHGKCVENIKNVASNARKSLHVYSQQQGKNMIDKRIVQSFKSASAKLVDAKKKYKEKSEKAIRALTILEKKIRSNMDKMDTSVQNDLEKLSKYETNITEVSADQEKMLKLAESLLGDVSDPQVIMGAKNLPKPDIDCDKIDVNFPNIESGLDNIIHGIEAMTNAVVNETKQETFTVQRGERQWDVKGLTTIGNNGEITGVTFSNKQLVVRTGRDTANIRLYCLDGKLIKETQVHGGQLDSGPISVDSRRDLYLLPCKNGTLVRADLDGTVTYTTKLGSNLCGVAYIPHHDLYVLSDYVYGNSRVFLVSPDTLTVVRSLKGPFSLPYNVCVGDINGVTTIVVSDYDSDKLFLFTVDGELIKTYGPKTTSGLRDLRGPRGVTVTKSGHIVVCNRGNQCVYRVCSDNDGDHWECLLDTRDVGWYPWYVAIDNNTRVMAVTTNNNSIKLYTL